MKWIICIFLYCLPLENTNNTSNFHLQAREFISKFEDLKQTHIFAKIENVEVRNLIFLEE
jgi:hypothetical protein